MGVGGGGLIAPCLLFHLAPRASAICRSSYCSLISAGKLLHTPIGNGQLRKHNRFWSCPRFQKRLHRRTIDPFEGPDRNTWTCRLQCGWCEQPPHLCRLCRSVVAGTLYFIKTCSSSSCSFTSGGMFEESAATSGLESSMKSSHSPESFMRSSHGSPCPLCRLLQRPGQ